MGASCLASPTSSTRREASSDNAAVVALERRPPSSIMTVVNGASAQDRETARLLLKNQQSALSQRLMQAVEAAYAIRSEPMPGTLDPAWDMSDSHFQSLFPTLVLQRPVGAIVLDGMSWAVCHELLNDFRQEHWFEATPDGTSALPTAA